MYTEILTDNGLTQEQWDNRLFREYIGMLWWKRMMGTSSNAVLQVKEDLTKAPGDAITFGLRGLLQGGHVTGRAKGIGNEGRVDFYNQRVVVDNVRHLVKFENVRMSQQRIGWNLLNQGREALNEAAMLRMEDDVTTALTTIGAERVRGRYLYGAADSNWNATHATALASLGAANDRLTLDMVEIAKRKALIPVNATARVRPLRVKMGLAFEEWYTFVAHTFAMRDLTTRDNRYINAHLNLPPQANRNSPLFSGASFKGAWNGVLLYEYERMPLLTSTEQLTHCLLLGAQAGGIAWAQRSRFGEEQEDVGHDVIYETHEIREEFKCVFSRAVPEDHGLVNVFASALSD